MLTLSQQLQEFNNALLESAAEFSRVAFDSIERFFELQLEIAYTFVVDSAQYTKDLANAKSAREIAALQAAAIRPGFVKSLTYSRIVFELAEEVQSDLSQSLERSAKELSTAVRRAFKHGGAGLTDPDDAIAALRSTLEALHRVNGDFLPASQCMKNLA